MTTRACRTGSGAPTFCWQCQNQLQRAPGKGEGLFYFHLVIGPGGNQHRVHGDCLAPALLDGCKFIQPVKQPHAIRKTRARTLHERDIERHLVKRVKELGGEVRKVVWPGRRGAPDRLVMLPSRFAFDTSIKEMVSVGQRAPTTIWVELKAPGVKPESHQLREHKRMRAMGQRVVAIDSIEGVEELLS